MNDLHVSFITMAKIWFEWADSFEPETLVGPIDQFNVYLKDTYSASCQHHDDGYTFSFSTEEGKAFFVLKHG